LGNGICFPTAGASLSATHLKIADDAGLKEVVALEFENKSSFGVLNKCVGALDGWLCWINVPLGRDTFQHFSIFFLTIISVIELKFEQFVILGADSCICHDVVPEELVIVGLSMELQRVLFCRTFNVVIKLLLTALTLYHHVYWLTRRGKKTIYLISICHNLGLKKNRHLVCW
jgi:hypothetical protein